MTSPATEAKIKEIVEFAATGREVLPMMFQPLMGRSNTVSAAFRVAVKRGLIVQDGVDGMGKPKYRAPIPAATHDGGKAVN